MSAAVVTAGVGLRFANPPAAWSGWLTPLVASGLVLVGLLARRQAAGLAWATFVVAAMLATAVPVANARSIDDAEHAFGEWLPAALAVLATAIPTALVAALYATRPDRRALRWISPVVILIAGWLVLAGVLLPVLVAFGARGDPEITWSDVALLPITQYVQLVLLLFGLGAAGDVLPALARVDRRYAAAGVRPGWLDRARATVEELTPGLAARQERDVEAERRRVAGDLHAGVLPALRRAIAEVEGGAGPERLAERLRAVDLELQRMLTDLWPMVLETFGLVEALEDLAEQIETESLEVTIDVGEAGGRPPAAVERAAYRIAQLACDNAVRHADASTIRIVVAVTGTSLRLAIVDDGAGLDGEGLAAGLRSGSHGLADLRHRAAAVGGEAVIEAAGAGGTEVRFTWPAAARDG